MCVSSNGTRGFIFGLIADLGELRFKTGGGGVNIKDALEPRRVSGVVTRDVRQPAWYLDTHKIRYIINI
jgi:hypothetical protein